MQRMSNSTLRAALTAALVLCLVALAGCSSASTPAPLTAAARLALFHRQLDRDWAAIAADYPDATRPVVGAPVSVNPVLWVRAFSDCLAEQGVSMTAIPGRAPASSAWFGSAEAQRLAYFACESQFPAPEAYAGLMSRPQLVSLYGYLVGFVRPCLAAAGVPSGPVPSESSFVAGYYSPSRWSPFASVGDTVESPDRYASLQHLCPEHPAGIPGG